MFFLGGFIMTNRFRIHSALIVLSTAIALQPVIFAENNTASGAISIDPLATRWTFGAHEPFTMYRRVGNLCTGGIDGNAVWVKDWLDWFDEHAPEKMEELGLNFLHSRFYKGMGWEVEKHDFQNVKKFVANCHAHGVTALAYVQFCTLYPELMRKEIPTIDDWATVDWQGQKNLYGGQYFRWAPCLNCREWEEYIKRMCAIALSDGGFDGIMFDNVFDYPCYCKRCQTAFRKHLASIPADERERRFGFVDVDSVLLPRMARGKMHHLETRDPVFQAWALWRSETMNGVMGRFRKHIKSVKPDAIVSGNPSPYRSRARFLDRAQNMAELCKAFDFIIMQNANFPEVKNSRIFNRVRDLKFAQDCGQRIVALCDTDTKIMPEREAKFLLPMVEDIVFGGIPTDRTVLAPSPEPGFLNREVYERRKRHHLAFNSFVASHRAALSSPTMHPVRIFYPEREVFLSETTHQGVVAAEEIFLRNQVPYGYLVSTPEDVMTLPEGLEVLVIPGLVTLSDAQIKAIVTYARNGGRLIVTGDSGRYDEWNAQRRNNPLLPMLRGSTNVVIRADADLIPDADLDWSYAIDPPKDGGRALMADLAKVGWRSPIRFSGLPDHVLVEYRRLASGGIVAHLVNYIPETPICSLQLSLQDGERAMFEEPFAENSNAVNIGADGKVPSFGMYAIITITHE